MCACTEPKCAIRLKISYLTLKVRASLMSSFMLPNSTLLYLKLIIVLKHNSRAGKRAEGKSLRVQPWTWVCIIHICVIIICDWCRLCSQHKRRWEKRKLQCFRNVAERVEKEHSNWILSPDRFPIFQFPARHVSNFAISSVILLFQWALAPEA